MPKNRCILSKNIHYLYFANLTLVENQCHTFIVMILILLLFLGSDAAMRPNAIVRSSSNRVFDITITSLCQRTLYMLAITSWVLTTLCHYLRWSKIHPILLGDPIPDSSVMSIYQTVLYYSHYRVSQNGM